jgi:Protein of unknown function (DUF4231)
MGAAPSSTPEPMAREAETSVPWQRLEDQVSWYDEKSQGSQRAYKRIKVVQLVAAAAIPVVAVAEATAWVTAALGGVVLVLEGLQQLGQYQQNWITYRSTCEALKHEKFLFLARAGPYADSVATDRVLAERVESLVSQEHAKWAAAREEARADRPTRP